MESGQPQHVRTSGRRSASSLLSLALFLALAPAALASTTWYVNGVSGSDNNNCTSPQTACKSIGHAISLASSGDSIMVAAATYSENLTIGFSLKIVGSGASTTIIDGGEVSRVVTISAANDHVTLSKLTIRNGYGAVRGGGIYNNGTLTVNNSTISGNIAVAKVKQESGVGGGIYNAGVLTINNSTINGNVASGFPSGGGGIFNNGTLRISHSTISRNSATGGGGILNLAGTLTISNSTLSENSGIYTISNGGAVTISNSTLSEKFNYGGIGNGNRGSATLQNSILARSSGRNCLGTMTSKGYNLSSDNTCNFNNSGDLNNTDPNGKIGRPAGLWIRFHKTS